MGFQWDFNGIFMGFQWDFNGIYKIYRDFDWIYKILYWDFNGVYYRDFMEIYTRKIAGPPLLMI